MNSLETKEVSNSTNTSIRCARHKRRFIVDLRWVKKCAWLCPKCYDKLSPDERLKYAPASARKKIDGNLSSTKSSRHILAKQKKIVEAKKNIAPIGKILIRDASLLPRYVMFCHKCRTWIPCHKVWFDANPFICPSCASSMSSFEMIKHRRRCEKAECMPELKKNTDNHGWEATPLAVSMTNIAKDFSPLGFDGYLNSLSNNQIERLSLDQLKTAVREGRLSKVRAKIELRRRQKKDYYNDLPEVAERKLCFR